MKIDRLFAGLNISAMGLSAQRKRMDAISANIANVETTRTESGAPYRRRVVSVESAGTRSFSGILNAIGSRLSTTDEQHFNTGIVPAGSGEVVPMGVSAKEREDFAPFRMVYDPSHPDADEKGFVQMPNVNIVTEMVDMIAASRTYEANVTATNAQKQMSKDALEI